MPEKGMPILEIPVYLKNEKELQSKFISKFTEEILNMKYATSDDFYVEEFYRLMNIRKHLDANKLVWKHNHIIGYIEVALSGQDIEINVYLPVDNRKIVKKTLRFNRSERLYFNRFTPNDNHFNINGIKTISELKSKIIRMVDGTAEFYFKGRYFDREYFLRTLDCVDIYKFIDLLEKDKVVGESKMKLGSMLSKVLNVSDEKVNKLFFDNHVIAPKGLLQKVNYNSEISNGDIVYVVGYGILVFENIENNKIRILNGQR